MVLHLVWSIPE